MKSGITLEEAKERAKEEWRDIIGYEGKYQVSNLGRVRSLQYHNTKGVKRIGLLKPAKDGCGYYRCALSKKNILTTYKVHRLVAAAFIPNPNNYPQINHKNGIKTDNRVENLEWCNNSWNQLHAYRTGLTPKHVGHKIGVKLTKLNTGEELFFDQIKKATLFLGISRDYLRQLSNRGKNIYKDYKFKILC